jgi:hypothetical protein
MGGSVSIFIEENWSKDREKWDDMQARQRDSSRLDEHVTL